MLRRTTHSTPRFRRTYHRYTVVALLACCAVVTSRSGVAEEKGQQDSQLGSRVKEVLRNRCSECHGGASMKGGLQLLDHASLLKSKAVVPGKPDESEVYRRVIARDESAMPEPPLPPLEPDEIDAIRQWIASGAPAFPEDVSRPAETAKDAAFANVSGVDYVLKQILSDLDKLPATPRQFTRYFSINHIVTSGATAEQMLLYRDALAKAINHLSWELEIVVPRAIDSPVNSIFAVDIRKLGWDARPLTEIRDGEADRPSDVDLFDLVLLEYPYGIVYEGSETFDQIRTKYLQPANLVRPIPYVRADWFVSVATQSPLYEDLLRLPLTVGELKERLKVDTEANRKASIAKRAGMTVSGVSRNNRVVERHPTPEGGFFWESIDFKSSKGADNIFRDPVNLKGAGGEFIFSLPNGLQGYLLAAADGNRIDAAPTEIVTDKFAADKTVRNGLACMRCHDKGMQTFVDTVGPALERLPASPGFDKRTAKGLYVDQKEMDRLLAADMSTFKEAMAKTVAGAANREPLTPVARHFLDDPIHLDSAAAELGLTSAEDLRPVCRTPQFSGLGLSPLGGEKGAIRRDAWEDAFDSVVRGLGLGTPIGSFDSLTRRDVAAEPLDVVFRTNKVNNNFEPGDEIVVFVENRSQGDLFIELVGISAKGEKVSLTRYVIRLAAGETHRFPPEGTPLRARSALGTELITLFASGKAFEPGKVLRGTNIIDRFVHEVSAATDAPQRGLLSKRTLEITTR